MVSRRPIATDPQGIAYRLTPLGESLRPLLESLIAWGAHHAKELDEVHRLLPCEAIVRDRSAAHLKREVSTDAGLAKKASLKAE